MTMRAQREDEPTVYAVRVAERARDALIRERERRAATVSPDRALDWYDDMLAAFRSLATYPQRCPSASEAHRFPHVGLRQLTHPANRRQAWRILFTVHEADASDSPTVRIHHARHGAQAELEEWPNDDYRS